MRFSRLLFYVIAVLAVSPLPLQAAESVVLEHSTARLVAASTTLTERTPLKVGAHILLEDGWHIYGENPGDAGLPSTIEWTLPDGFTAGNIEYPRTQTFKEGELTTYGYDEEVVLPVTLQVPYGLAETTTIQAKVEYLACKDICIPQTAELSLTLPRGEFSPSDDVDLIERFTLEAGGETSLEAKPLPSTSVEIAAIPMENAPQTGDMSLLLAVVFAFLGGVILNLMPCVFPVLSLKLLALTQYNQAELAHGKKEAVAYTLGILSCFGVIVGLLIAAQQAGGAIGWGYQFQSAGFVGVLALLLFMVGLNLSGVFHLPSLFGNAAANIENPHSLKGSFATGLLATLVATPCTAPFMAPAIGFALTQTPAATLLVFASLGLGLAAPFLLMSFFPPLTRLLPKSGPWLESFKQFLAFPMYASSVWLAWVVGTQAGAMGMALLLMCATSMAFLLWLKTRFGSHTRWCHIAMAFVLLALAATLAQGLTSLSSNATTNAQTHTNSVAYSAEKLAELRAAGTPVYLDATAAWCITCQVNYQSSLNRTEVQQAFQEKGIVFMVADWTKKDAAITELLGSFGFKGVPMNVYFPPNGAEPIVLPQVLTPRIVLDAIADNV
jgi:thiol:disulfide interchange protein